MTDASKLALPSADRRGPESLAALSAERSRPPASDDLFCPYRSPGFLVEPLPRDSRDGSLPTTLGLCAALSLLGGSFTLSQAGPPALGVLCLVAAVLFASAARNAS
jgi:hypothetical protein